MDLILWRHAQAENLLLDQLQTDQARRLTPKGHHQAERMAQWLNQRLPQATRVLVSPAQRTQQTALALGRSFETAKAVSPSASVDDLLALAKWPQSQGAVLIVGHQPTLGMAAARLLTGHDLAWSVKKGAVWWLRLQDREGKPQVTLLAVQSPDLI